MDEFKIRLALPTDSALELDPNELEGLEEIALTNAKELLANEITIFKDRVRIDVQTSTPGIEFHDAWLHRKTIVYSNQEFYILSKKDLIASKKAAGREIDLSDVHLLELPTEDIEPL